MVEDNRIELLQDVCKTPMLPLHQSSILAGKLGIEPRLSVLETEVLPLNYSPIIGVS